MPDLLINAIAANRTSLGGRRYLKGVLAELRWPTLPQFVGDPNRRLARVSELLMSGRSDAVLWSPAHRGPLFAQHHVVTVFDCINLEYGYANTWREPLLHAAMSRLLSNAEAVVTISHSTRDVVLRLFGLNPAKVIAIPGPVSFRVDGARSDQARKDTDYVLIIANRLGHKNTRLALSAFARSRARILGIGIVVVGSADEAGIEACRRAGIDLRIVSGLADADLEGLMDGCRFLWSPSLQEGLNLPIAEALSRGIDVLASDIPVHREFYDGEVAFFDPSSEDLAIEALDAAFQRPHPWPRRLKDKRELTFSAVATAYHKVFDRVAANLDGKRVPHA